MGGGDAAPDAYGTILHRQPLKHTLSQWRPALFEGIKPIEPYLENPDYNLNTDLADYNIKYIEQHTALSPDKPWMIYYAPGAKWNEGMTDWGSASMPAGRPACLLASLCRDMLSMTG